MSNVVCALQQQVCTLSTENVTLKTVIRNLKNQSTSSSKPTPDCSSDNRFPQPANPLPPGRPRKARICQSSSVLGPPPRLRLQFTIKQLRPLNSDRKLPTDQRPATSQTTRAVAQQQRCPNGERRRTPDRQRPVATRTARPASPLLHLVSVWQSSGLPQA